MRNPLRQSIALLALLLAIAAGDSHAQPRFPLPLPPKPPLGETPPSPDALLKQVAEKLKLGDVAQRIDAAEQLPSLGAFGSDIVADELAKACGDENGHVRLAALHGLAAMGADGDAALPAVHRRIDLAEGDYEQVLAIWAAAKIDPGEVNAEWTNRLIEAMGSKDQAIHSLASESLITIGRPAHPAVIAALDSADRQKAYLLIDVLGRSGARGAVEKIAPHLKSDSTALRARAAEALGQIGPAAKATIPELQRIATTDESAAVRARAANALGAIGISSDETIAALTTVIEQERSEIVVREAVNSLAQLASDPEEVTRLMAPLLKDKRPEVVTAALSALGDQGEETMPVLLSALDDNETRYWALLAISDLGPEAKDAVPRLNRLLGTANTLDRREALMALANIGPGAESAVPEISKQLADDDLGVRYAATFALGQIGKSDGDAKTALSANLRSEDPMLKMTSAWAIGKLEGSSPLDRVRAVRELAAGLASEDPILQQAAAQCLAELKPGPQQLPALLPKVVGSFESGDLATQLGAIDAIEAMLQHPEAADVLNKLLSNEATRPLAANVASRLGPKAKGSASALAEALADDRPGVRQDVAIALASLGPDAKPALETLIQTLRRDSDGDVRNAAAFALGKIGPGAGGAAEALTQSLADESIQSTAAWALVQISGEDGDVAKAVVPQLIRDLDANRAEKRAAAAQSLAQLGPAAAKSAGALQYAVEDPDPAVRRAAAAALQKIQGE